MNQLTPFEEAVLGELKGIRTALEKSAAARGAYSKKGAASGSASEGAAHKIQGVITKTKMRSDWLNIEIGELWLSTKKSELVRALKVHAQNEAVLEIFYTEKQNGDYTNRYVEKINVLDAGNPPEEREPGDDDDCPV